MVARRFFASDSLRGFCLSRSTLALVCGLSLSLIAPDAQGQFNARGRRRTPPKAQPQKPRPASPNTAGDSTRSRGGTSPSKSTKLTSETQRRDELIARYEKLILTQPGEEVPLVRLATLVRERDGNLQALLQKLKTPEPAEKDAYPRLTAYAGLLALDSQSSEALATIKEATALSPRRASAWLLQARLQKKLGAKSEARAAYRQALPLVSGPEKTFVLRELRDLSLDLGDFAEAGQIHKTLVKSAAGNLFLKGELGRELLKRGETERAVAELDRVVRSSGGDNRALAPALRDLGQAQVQAGQLDEAIASLTRASRLSAANPGQRMAIESLLADAHRQAGSLPEYLQTLSKTSSSAPRLTLLGRLYEESGNTEAAISAYRRALRVDPRNIDTQLKLVRLYELSGRIDDAVKQYAALVKSSPRDVQLSLRYMEMLLAQGHRDRVLREWDRAERITRADPEAALMLIDIAERLEERKRAEIVLTRLAKSKQGDAHFLVELGARFYRKGDEKNALLMWKRILLVERDATVAHLILGEVLIDHGDIKGGLKELVQAVFLSPRNIKARRALALGLERAASQSTSVRKRRFEHEALAHFQKILELPRETRHRSTQTLARRHIVRIWRRGGDLPEKMALLEKQLNSSPPDLAAGRLLAEAQLAIQDYPAAIISLEQILESQPGDRESLLALESAYTRSGQFDRVIATLKRLLQSDPARAREYYERMARAANQKGDSRKALHFAELAVSRSPGDARAQAQLGELFLLQGQTEKAESAFRRALEKDNRLHDVALKLADLLAQSGRSDESLLLLLQITRSASEPDLVARAGRRALSMSIPLGKAETLEDTLRPLAISRPERPLYRQLLLEALSAQMLPLTLKARHGSPAEKKEARARLTRLADRSTQPLLSALSSDNAASQEIAIQALSFGSSQSAHTALVAFAEGAGAREQRISAVLSAGRHASPELSPRFTALLIQEGRVLRGRFAQALVWALSQTSDSTSHEALLRCLREGSPSVKTYAALGLAHSKESQRPAAQKQSLTQLLATLRNNNTSELPRAGAALALSYFGRTAAGSISQSESEISRALVGAARSHSPLIRRAALFALANYPATADSRTEFARALLSTDASIRSLAKAAVVRSLDGGDAMPLFPDVLGPQDLNPENHFSSLFKEMLRVKLSNKARHRALISLTEELNHAVGERLLSSQGQARGVIQQFRSRAGSSELGFTDLLKLSDFPLAPDDKEGRQAAKYVLDLRSRLTPLLLALSVSGQKKLEDEAISLLRPSDGAQVLERLKSGLTTKHFVASLSAISRENSSATLALIDHALDAKPRWSQRRRIALALGQLWASAPDEQLKGAFLERLEVLQNDPSGLVKQAAQDALNAERVLNTDLP